ncbi:unnamed protein product [Ectocarpus sp. CCAP 1310/34]|nr:unnamed protein product [Ectocarpus sp. CCAP 1310/34]
MTRLHRAKLGRERLGQCMHILLLAVVCAALGEDDLFLVLGAYWMLKWRAYLELVAPTQLGGVRYDFMEVLGGFDFKEVFRFEKSHFRQLLAALELPPELEIRRGGFGTQRIPASLALAVTLWRFAAPTTLLRDRLFWGMGETLVCEVFNVTVEAIHERWGHLVEELQVEAILSKIDGFCEAISNRGAPLPRCWGFLDGTLRKICRPGRWQRLYYNGWKRFHALKYQAVDSPDGIIRQLWGPMLGRRHDVALLGQSNLLGVLQQSFNDAQGEPYYLYGDPAYQNSPWLIAPYRGGVLTPAERGFNAAMSGVRVTVEWGFGRIVAQWPYVDYHKKQQVGLSACGLGKQHAVAGILTNCHCCFYPNSTAQDFDVQPPSLEEYLQGEG